MNATKPSLAELNDQLRQSHFRIGTLLITNGIQSLGQESLDRLLHQIIGFDDFNIDNDPYGDHDFGSFEFEGHRIFWKIDCYDLTMNAASPDPRDDSVSKRVITVMLAEEY